MATYLDITFALLWTKRELGLTTLSQSAFWTIPVYAGNAVSVLFEFLQRLSEYSIGEVLEVVVEPEKIALQHKQRSIGLFLLGGERI